MSITQTKEGLRLQGEQGSTTLVLPPNSQTTDKYVDVGNLSGGGGVETLTVGAGIVQTGTATNPIIASGDPWLNTAPWTVARLAEDVTLNTTGGTPFTVAGLSLSLDTVDACYEFMCLAIPSPTFRGGTSGTFEVNDIGDNSTVFMAGDVYYVGSVSNAATDANRATYWQGVLSLNNPSLPVTINLRLQTAQSYTNFVIAAGSFLAVRKLGV